MAQLADALATSVLSSASASFVEYWEKGAISLTLGVECPLLAQRRHSQITILNPMQHHFIPY